MALIKPEENYRSIAKASDSAIGPPEQNGANPLEDEVGQPKDQVWKILRLSLERLAKNEEAVIEDDEQEGHRDAESGFPPMRAYPQRNTDQRETDAGKRKCRLAMDLDLNGAGKVQGLLLVLPQSLPQFFRRSLPDRRRMRQFRFHVAQFRPQLEKGHITQAHPVSIGVCGRIVGI